MTDAIVFVVGSLHYDIVVNAPHLPARDETVMGGPMAYVCGGKGGNQAVAASRHGASTAFAGAVGDDQFGHVLLENLRHAGVDVSQVRRTPNAASGASVAIVEPDGEYGAVVASGANREIDADTITIPENTRCLVLQNEVPDAVNAAIAERCKTSGVAVILNAAPWRPLNHRLEAVVDLLIVNRIEASALFDREVRGVEDAIDALRISSNPIATIVVTLGAAGLVYREAGKAPCHIEAPRVVSVSAHGAGDAFVGALCSRLAVSENLDAALRYASAAAALFVSTPVADRAAIDRRKTLAFESGQDA